MTLALNHREKGEKDLHDFHTSMYSQVLMIWILCCASELPYVFGNNSNIAEPKCFPMQVSEREIDRHVGVQMKPIIASVVQD